MGAQKGRELMLSTVGLVWSLLINQHEEEISLSEMLETQISATTPQARALSAIT